MRVLLLFLALLPSLGAAELRIAGVGGELEENIRAYVALASETCEAEDWRIRRRFRTVEAEARRALEPFGYYQPTITSSLELGEGCWHAELTVDPGPAVLYRYVHVVVSGAATSDPVFQEQLPPRDMQRGTQLRHRHFDRFKETLQVAAIDRGYVEARFTVSQIDIWPDELAADVILRFESGPRYDIGEIIQEQSFLDPMLVAGYLSIETGVPYDAELLASSYRDLSNSGFFGRIDLIPDLESAKDGRIPIRVSLTPAERIEYTLGAGYSTDSGPRFRAGYKNRRVNDNGHRLTAELGVSPLISGISAEYRKPLSDPRVEWLSYTAALGTEDTASFDNDTFRLGVRRSRRIHPDWIRTQSLDLSYERFDVGGEKGETRLLLPGILFDHKQADRDIVPSRGRRLAVVLQGTHEVIGSDTTFLQLIGRGRWIRSLGTKTRLLARVEMGFTAKTEFGELPPSVRFFAGGDDSVRGYDYQSLGPKNASGAVVGGDNLLVSSVEIERQLRGNFYAAAFVDAGNAFDGYDVDPAIGTGLGLIWRSPVGPLRLYVARPLNKSDDNFRIHVRLGADL